MARDYNKLILDKLENYTNVYFTTLEHCAMSFSEKHIHDYRVSIRRLVSLLKFIDSYLPNVYVQNLLKYLKWKMKLLSPLRDVQVQLLRINAFENKYADLQDFYFYLFRKEKFLTDNIKHKITEIKNTEITANLIWLKLKLIEVFRNYTIDDEIFLKQYSILKADVSEKMSAIDKENDESIHTLRLTFKKYRYYMEIITPIFPDNKDEIKKLRKLQNTMGAIQDIFVISSNINLFIQNNVYQLNKDYLNFSYDLTADKQYLKTKLYKQIESYNFPTIEKTIKKIIFP